jgi:serine/threonine protein kinase
MASNSFRIGCLAGTCWLTSRTTLMQIGLDLYVSLLLWLSHAYSRHQLSDVARGLCYLHSRNVIHGDLKGVRGRSKSRFATALTHVQLNILVDDSGHARLADFGFATVTQNLDSIRSAQSHRGYTVQWAAPEILMGDDIARKQTFSLSRWS